MTKLFIITRFHRMKIRYISFPLVNACASLEPSTFVNRETLWGGGELFELQLVSVYM